MNVKNPTGLGVMAISLFLGVAPQVVMRWIEKSDPQPLQIAIAKLEAQVANLTDQLSKFTGQPYVRRDEFEGRVSGLEQRVNMLERSEQQRR